MRSRGWTTPSSTCCDNRPGGAVVRAEDPFAPDPHRRGPAPERCPKRRGFRSSLQYSTTDYFRLACRHVMDEQGRGDAAGGWDRPSMIESRGGSKPGGETGRGDENAHCPSVNNELASRIEGTKFDGGIGDINPRDVTDTGYERELAVRGAGRAAFVIIGLLRRHPVRWRDSGRYTRCRTTPRPAVYGRTGSSRSVRLRTASTARRRAGFAGSTVTDRF